MAQFPLAALFDMDGVLVDNIKYHVAAWQQLAKQHGYTLTLEQFEKHMNGRVAKDSLEYLFQRPLPPEELTAYAEEKERMYRELYRPHLQPTTGLISFLDNLKAHGVPMAVGTSAPASNVSFTLDGTGIRPYFSAVIDSSMIVNGKPDPEIYLTAAKRLGAEPGQCVVFEDALSGIQAGLRAGMKVVALATTHTPAELASTGASQIVADFTSLDFNALAALLNP